MLTTEPTGSRPATSPAAVAASGRTSWKRLALVMVPTVAAAGAVVASLATGALAASFGVSANSFTVAGESFQISSSLLEGDGFVQFGVLDRGRDAVYPEALSAVRRATLHDLCQSVVQPVPVIGPVTLRLTADPASADRLIADTHDIKGDAVFENIHIGQDASTVDQVPGVREPAGAFAQQATTIRIRDLRQENRSVSAATFRLPDLHVQVLRGDHSCF
ncbi:MULTISPECIES: DUF6230 family protein [unclassified Streptomyces]|uniref:DUF6230 family protein n=1 Tax=unclassified Streptomyces TaxID=2593676 RepID=UPI0003806ED8|nr:DUF6230 family protein [Streptomyces sp. BoleA5]MYX36027.1 cholesterol esterase [Streptomyces sp. SID8377]